MFQPFVDADHVIQSYFPDRMYAMLIPVVAGVLALSVVGMNSSSFLLPSSIIFMTSAKSFFHGSSVKGFRPWRCPCNVSYFKNSFFFQGHSYL